MNEDGEVFEKVVFDLMLNKYSDDKELTEYVLSLPKEQQRMVVLSLIDDDNNLWTKMNTFVDECNDELEHIKEVIKIMFKFVKEGDVEKKKFGEVMTPLDLVIEMLNTLPKEVWSNPNLKWLDPCNGAGTFPLVVIYKLMKGLSSWEPNIEKRYKHIVENMIYTCELQSRNVFLWLCGVDPKDKYTTNTYWGSFLDSEFDNHMKTVWGVEKFDIVIGNPPYQMQKPVFTKTQPIWHLFVQKSLELLQKDGYMIMVHPSGWRNLEGVFKETQNRIKSKSVLFLEMHSQYDGVKIFGAKTDYDFYLVKNNDDNVLTEVKGQNGVTEFVNIKEWDFIPNGMFNEISKLVATIDQDRVKILSGSSYHTQKTEFMSKEQTDEFKYPCAYTVMKRATKFWYSNTNKRGHFGIPKFIWGNGEIDYIGSEIDEDGSYGLTQFTYAIIDDISLLGKIKEVFDGKEFKEIMNMCCVGKFSINHKILSTFRKDFWKEFI